MDSVKVAVRVRPFNKRELDLNSRLCVSMSGKKTRITNPKPGEKLDTTQCDDIKEFTYDFSYWSFDPSHSVYHSQEEIYQNLGVDVVDNAYVGYNACVFAYGQTGSGKTYTMMGTQAERGLIPRICYRLFDKMDVSSDVRYRVEVSYLEIYNEQVRDLLQQQQSHSLRVREHPQTGPYVEELSKHLVSSYADIADLMERGNAHRTTASTGMNDTSSRSHAIFTVQFTQAALLEGMPSERTSKIHLVDLAGSERAKATGASGSRLREGAHINRSLVTLGSVISALAEAGARRGRAPFVPYRDSTLTWLLRDSLGGNAKTVMIAAISPADVNYGETLSTLRYAHRAKSIVNRPTVNEDTTVQLIRSLREEIARLRALIQAGAGGEAPRALELIQEKEARADQMTSQWMEGWQETQLILQEQKTLGLRKSGVGVVLDSDGPHLIGIDDDLTSTGITLYQLRSERTVLGSAPDCDIVVEGGGVAPRHCVITLTSEGGQLTAVGDAVCSVDQADVDGSHPLYQGCVITLGEGCMFRYNSPAEAARLRRAGVRRASSRLSVLSLPACDLAAARSVESLLAREKRLSWGSSRELSRLRQPSEPSLARRRLSVSAGYGLLDPPPPTPADLPPDGALPGPAPEAAEGGRTGSRRPDGTSTLPAAPAQATEGQDGAQTAQSGDMPAQNGGASAQNGVAPTQSSSVTPSPSTGLTQDGELSTPQKSGQSPPSDASMSRAHDTTVSPPHDASLCALDTTTLSQPSLNGTTGSSLSAYPNSTTTGSGSPPPLSSTPLAGLPPAAPAELDPVPPERGRRSPRPAWLPLSPPPPTVAEAEAEVETGDSEADSLESQNGLWQDDEALGAAIEQEVQRRVSEQLALQEQRLRAERTHQQLLNERQLARLHFTHQRQIRKLKSALSTVYSSVPSLADQLVSDGLFSDARTVSVPGLTGGDVSPPAAVVAVPRFLLRGAGRDAHFEYEVRLAVGGERYTLYRRYQRFRELRQYVARRYGEPAAARLPPARLFGRTSETLAAERRGQLEEYLRQLLERCAALPGCPLQHGLSRRTLAEFAPFFQRGVFEFSRAMTS